MDRPICFFSDYGYTDDFAGVCRAVIARLAPQVRGIDVTHGPRAPRARGRGRAAQHAAVHAGQGGHPGRRRPGLRLGPSGRSPSAAHGDHLFVGPDNRLPTHAADADGGVSDALRAEQSGTRLGPALGDLPRPRHLRPGRRASAGRPPPRRPSATRSGWQALDRIDVPEPRRHRDGLTAIAVLVDRFGNVCSQPRVARPGEGRVSPVRSSF